MSAAMAKQASGPFWRAAGMACVSFVNTCASMLRNCLKEPHRLQAASREEVCYKIALWERRTEPLRKQIRMLLDDTNGGFKLECHKPANFVYTHQYKSDSLIEWDCKNWSLGFHSWRPCGSLKSKEIITPHHSQKLWLNTESEKQKEKKKKKQKSKRGIIKKLKQIRYKTKIKKANMDHEQKLLARLEKAKKKIKSLKEALKDYELPPLPPAKHDPEMLTAEELHYLKRLGYKHKNYMILGMRGVFGGVVLNMHLHWKKHQLIKIRCKNFSKEEIDETGEHLARLSGGIVVDVQKGDTIVMYRGRNYKRPEELTPKNSLSKRKALFKAKFEQSLESMEENVVALEKELALYREFKAKEEAGLFSQKPTGGYFSSWSDTDDEKPAVPSVWSDTDDEKPAVPSVCSESEDVDVDPAFVCESDSVLETESDLEGTIDIDMDYGSESDSECALD